jgi:dTDP-4-amino-4,6-dideoxygalactose transaminase
MSRLTAFPIEDYRAHQVEIDRAVGEVLRGGWYVLGGEVTAFEEEFAAFVGAKHAVGVANGTDAIELILRALEIGVGDRVVVPSHTAVASASAVIRVGAEPVFVDVDGVTKTICPERLEELLGSEMGRGVKAVLAVHIYGHPCEMEALEAVCGRHGVTLLEDCAQSHGAMYRGRNAGSMARAAAFSFYPTKNLGAVGDGGAITTSDEALAERIKVLRQYGWVGRYVSDFEGINSRLDELQAAILRVKLRTLPERLAKRRMLAGVYEEMLAGVGVVERPEVRADCVHGWHLYVVRSAEREALMAHLSGLGIPVAVHYPVPIHLQPGYVKYAERSPALPVTEALSREVLSLPMHPYLDEAGLAEVVAGVRSFEQGRGAK